MLGMIFDGMLNNMVVGILLVCVGIPVVAGYWYKASIRSSDNELKRSMVERGFSAAEIERVINAGDEDAKKQ